MSSDRKNRNNITAQTHTVSSPFPGVAGGSPSCEQEVCSFWSESRAISCAVSMTLGRAMLFSRPCAVVALQLRALSVLAASSRPSPVRMTADGKRTAGMPPMISTASSMFASHQAIAKRASEYFDSSPDPFHATENMCKLLADAGWTELDEREPWAGKIKPGGKYYYTRNRSCIVALAVGAGYTPGNGFKVIGAHTDSPNLRIKPRSKRSGSGCIQLDVECYGGGLWHTWFDRDLSVCGRVLVRREDGGIDQRLVKVDRPILRVPTLCIHLQSAEEREAFKVNKEEQCAARSTNLRPCARGVRLSDSLSCDLMSPHVADGRG